MMSKNKNYTRYILNLIGKTNYQATILKIKNIADILKEIEQYWKFPENASLSEKVYYYLHEENPYCDHNIKKKFYSYKKGYSPIGYKCESCKKVVKNKIKETFMKKYGVSSPLKNEKIKEKVKETNRKKYGAENPFSSEEIKKKIKEKIKKRYNVEYPSQSKEIQQKIKNTFQKNYGVNFPTQSDIIKEKVKKHVLKRYGVENVSKAEEIKEKIKNTCFQKYGTNNPIKKHIRNLKEWDNNFSEIYEKFMGNEKKLAKYFGVSGSTIRRRVVEAGLREKYFSSIEKNIHNFLETKKIFFESRNRKILNGLEIDIYIPEKLIGIEIHGLFWHSYSRNFNSFYHYEKFLQAKNKGIILLQIFEDEWYEKQEKMKKLIENFFHKKYDFISFGKKELKMDNRFHPGDELLSSKGYKKEKTVLPKKWYTDYIIRKPTAFEGYKDVIYDAGYEIWKLK